MQESNPLRSIVAIIVGFLAVVVLSLGTDQVLHMLKVYPPWGDPMPRPGLNALALSYRIVFTIFGTLGAVATIPMHLGPAWYPIALAATALPCAWIGGALVRGKQAEG